MVGPCPLPRVTIWSRNLFVCANRSAGELLDCTLLPSFPWRPTTMGIKDMLSKLAPGKKQDVAAVSEH